MPDPRGDLAVTLTLAVTLAGVDPEEAEKIRRVGRFDATTVCQTKISPLLIPDPHAVLQSITRRIGSASSSFSAFSASPTYRSVENTAVTLRRCQFRVNSGRFFR